MREVITFNLTSKATHRFAKLDGRPHIVVPMVMIKKGVWEGSNGRIFYPEKHLRNSTIAWNHKPIVVDHPKKGEKYVSGSLPDVINSHRIGHVLNTQYRKGKLGAEAWLDIQKTNAVDKRIIPAIIKREPVEVSTGLGITRKRVDGVYNGKKYRYEGRFHQPDHLAVLPDEMGACSVRDGAGLMQLNRALVRARKTDRGLYRATVDALEEAGISITRNGRKLKIGFDSPPEEKEMVSKRKFNRKLAIRKLITNGLFAKEDREELLETPASVLQNLLANVDFGTTKKKKVSKVRVINREDEDDEDDEDEDSIFLNRRNQEEDEDEDEEEVVKNKGRKSLKEWLRDAKAPPEVLATLNRATRLETQRKKKLIQTITANESNVFKKSFLRTLEPDLLEGIAVLAAGSSGESDGDDDEGSDIFVDGFAPNYGGAGFGNTRNSRRRDEEEDDDESPLPLPTLNFKKKKKAHAYADDDEDEGDEE